VAVALCGVILYQTGCAPAQKEEASAPAMTSVEQGKYLVNIVGMKNGRPVLPPMVVQGLQGLTDEDLRAIFDYLKSLPPIHNRIPDPLPPPVKS
jgi:hypothetical protein